MFRNFIKKNDSRKLSDNDGFILPGVGSFNSGMSELRKTGLDKTVLKLIDDKIKGMGICLGMQMLCDYSEEGDYKEKGLGIFKGKLRKLLKKNDKVPNMGWNKTSLSTTRRKMPVSSELNESFYYVHSYGLSAENDSDVVATFEHGKTKIAAAIYKDSILGVQFHPEKSQAAGLLLLKNYFS